MASKTEIPIFGFDIGTENCYVCEPGEDGIKIKLNEGLSNVPSYMCILDDKRLFGYDAKNKQILQADKTFYNLKRLLGKTYDEVVKEEKLLYPIEKGSSGELLIRVSLLDEVYLVTPTQLLSMFLKKLKYSCDFTPRCIISCPNYFTDAQRRELINAAAIVDLKVIQILPDLSAAAHNYFLNDISDNDKQIPHYVAFVDIGATSTQCSITSYCPEELRCKVLVLEFDKNLGGKNFDEALANYFINEKKLKLDNLSRLRLINECEKLKMKMTSQSDEIVIEIKNLSKVQDFKSSMNRKKFEELCKEYLDRIECVLQKALTKFTSQKGNSLKIDASIKVVKASGGSSKIPIIKEKIQNIFGINITPGPNKCNETVAISCAQKSIYYEQSSKKKNLAEFKDYQPYQINGVFYEEKNSDSQKHEIDSLINVGSEIPFFEQFILNCNELPMIFEFSYVDEYKNVCPFGKYRIYSNKNITFLKGRLFVQIRLDKHGIFKISSVLLEIIEKDSSELPKQETKDAWNGLNFYELDVEIISLKGYLDKKTLIEYKDFEKKFDDSVFFDIKDLKYTLKNYIKRWTERLKRDDFRKYLNSDSIIKFIKELEETEIWLKNKKNCESKNKKAYFKRVTSLNTYIHKIDKTIHDEEVKKNYCKELDFMFILAKKNQSNIKAFECTLDQLYSFNEEGFLVEKQEWINEKLNEPQNDEYKEDPQYSYSICQKKLDILKYFILNSKSKNE